MKYRVDIKLFVNVEIDASNEQEARAVAEEFIRSSEPTEQYIDGFNNEQTLQALPGRVVTTFGYDIDGLSEVEPA